MYRDNNDENSAEDRK